MAYSMTVKLSPEQLDERRRQLNRAGFHAWLSPLVILLGVYIYRRFLGALIARALDTRQRLDASTHVHPKTTATATPTRHAKPVGIRLFFHRTAWLLQTTYIPEFGPLYVQLLGLVYTLWLFYLTTRNTGTDYMHVTKAFGHVAVSQLPWQYLLSLKTSTSPVTLMTGLTHERSNAVHRLFGRIVHLFLAVHAVLYLRFFVAMGVLAKRVGDMDVRLGVLAFWTANFLGVFALPVVRRRVYHVVFYRSHVLLSALLVPVLWFHVPSVARWLVGQMAIVYIFGAVARLVEAKDVSWVGVRVVEGTDLVTVQFHAEKGGALARAVPGQHVYVVGGRKGGLRTKTPFTIANVDGRGEGIGRSHMYAAFIPAEKVEISLVVRKTGGPGTADLASLRQRTGVVNYIRIEGPYGEASKYMPSYLDPSSHANGPIILIAGGIGVTYTLPIYVALLTSPNNRGRKIKFIWLVKTHFESRWVIELLLKLLHDTKIESQSLDVEIFITRPTPPELQSVASSEILKINNIEIHDLGRRPGLKDSIDEAFVLPSVPGDDTKNLVSHDEEVSVFVCGPGGLSRDVRRIAGRWVWRDGRRVRWFEEVFGFGGS